MGRIARFACLLSLVVVALANNSYGQVSNTWSSAGQMSQVRTGAAAVLLRDGRVLITGGSDAGGLPTASTEYLNPTTGAFSPAPAMSVARANHAAVVLTDGEVLVTGGATSGGAYSDTAEIYNPATQQWTLLNASLGTGRTGHAMALLTDGNVLIAGGESTSGPVATLQLFNMADHSITSIGSMITARTDAAAAATPDGRVLIAGGTDSNNNILASTEIFVYAPSTLTGTISAGPAMSCARSAATATSTYDGVAIIGGYNVQNGTQTDLGTAEIFSQWTNAFRVVSGATPRSGHFAVLLPANGSILAMGGTGGQTVDLLQPWANGLTGAFAAAASSLSNHSGGFAAPASLGSMLAAGGQGTSAAAAELYWFPTISTDQPDYAPGTPVVMTGAGFQPSETVDLHLHEWVNQTTTDTPDYKVTALSDGTFSFSGYAPTTTDIGARYHLTAVGETSGYQAQTIFTDSTKVSAATVEMRESTCTNATGTFAQGQTVCAYVSVTATNGNGGGSFYIVWYHGSTVEQTTTETIPSTTPKIFTDTYTTTSISPTGTWTVKVCDNANCSGAGNVPATTAFTLNTPLTTNLAVAAASGSYGGTVSLSATLSSAGNPVSGQNVSFTLNNAPVGEATTDVSGVAALTGVSLAGFNAGSYSGYVYASFAGGSGYAASSGSNSLKVNSITPSFTSLTASQDISYGTANVMLSGKLTGSPVNPPMGSSVSITINGVSTNTTTTDAAGDFSASVTTSALDASAVPYTITYSYAATTNFNSISDTSTALAVNRSDTQTTVGTITPEPSVVGQSYTVNVSVAAKSPGSGTPTGTVTIGDGATTCTATLSSGAGSCALTSTTAGSKTISADYSGDTNFNTSSGTASHTVNKADSTSMTASSVNPSVYGQSVTFTATVTAVAPGSGTPTGSVTFKDGATALATQTLNGSGVATYSTSSLSVATHFITAVYSGDTNFNATGADAGSTAPALSQVVNQAVTTTVVISSKNPSVLNESVTFTATVSVNSPGAGTPTGTVTFTIDGVAQTPSALSSALTATFTTNSLGVSGTGHTVSATYSGDDNFQTSNGDLVGGQVVQYAGVGICDGDAGHQILQPIVSGSVFKSNSTTPAKFRVCDAKGVSIGTPGVVSSFVLVSVTNGTVTTADETVDSTTPDAAFRWDPTGQQWIFNISNKSLAGAFGTNKTFMFLITLNDGTIIPFQYGLR